MSTIHDVALAAGVSVATVSRALRGLPRVHEETRARVLRVAAELNYVASPTAASLASGKTRVVGVVVPFVTRWYFASLINGAEKVLREHGYHVLLFDVGSTGVGRSFLLDQQTLWKRVDAVLVLTLALEPSEYRLLESLGVPVVTVGVQAGRWDCVRIDDVAAAETATCHLAGLGHKRIGYVGGNPDHDIAVATPFDRRAGYERALERHGLALDESLCMASDWTVRGGVAAGEELLTRPDRPTAVFAASDEMAMGVLFAAKRLGLEIPRDLSLIGIDDHELAFTHDLTTISQPVREQGHMAGQLLLDALAGTVAAVPRVITAPTQLVVRGTTRALRAGARRRALPRQAAVGDG